MAGARKWCTETEVRAHPIRTKLSGRSKAVLRASMGYASGRASCADSGTIGVCPFLFSPLVVRLERPVQNEMLFRLDGQREVAPPIQERLILLNSSRVRDAHVFVCL